MTDITDEQRAAWEEVKDQAYDVAELLAPLLPSDLTNPQPVLPTEPGHYQDEEGRHWLHQVVHGPGDERFIDQWLDWNGKNGAPPTGKLTRLVPERTEITREQVEGVIADQFRLPAWRMSALLALVNGADQ